MKISNGTGSSMRSLLLSLGGLMAAGSLGFSSHAEAAISCTNTVTANVVAIDQPIMFNRLGAQNINYMTYALRRDVVVQGDNPDNTAPPSVLGNEAEAAAIIAAQAAGEAAGQPISARFQLRPDKRPRPLVLRVAAGDCLKVNLQNLLHPRDNPRNAEPPIMQIDDQVAGRYVSFRPFGMDLVNSIDDDGSFVGKNANSLLAPGQSKSYTYYGGSEGAFMAYSDGQPLGGEASGGNIGVGLFGVVNVQPVGAKMYRSKLTEEEQRLATSGFTPGGQPITNYEAVYPNVEPWISEGKAGLPIINMLTPSNEIVHSDIDAVIAGPKADGSFPASTYPLESQGFTNPSLPTRLEPFREFTVVFHDEQAVSQAFPKWFSDPVLKHTLHGVRDSFMINYGSGGIGTEIIANRLGVGPMHDCLTCAYEEFFLTAFTVGDVGQLVDVPANTGLENCDPALNNCTAVGPKATEVFFPDDPSNVHHSYVGDFVKFRNLHAGPKEQHIFHLHNHQWLFNPNDDNANYIDAQGIGPGSGYTFEINFGGSGNRNKSAGDAIFHCHFYPHFAQGMWEMWRIYDTHQTGTVLAASNADDPQRPTTGFHDSIWGLKSGAPATGSRALPDGEIVIGTPIPAVVALPGKAMAPMPSDVTVVAQDINGDGIPESSQSKILDRTKNPGFPFWVAGMEDGVGQRPTTPPLDMLTEAEAEQLKATGDPLWGNMSAAQAGGFDGGLPRHALNGYIAGGVSEQRQNRLDFTKVVRQAKPLYYPEIGTDLEILAMKFHAQREHPSYAVTLDGSVAAAPFVLNGQKPVPSAPFHEPCADDTGKLFTTGAAGNFFDGQGGTSVVGIPKYGADAPRVYKGANIQIDAVFNKAGYHFPQQRIITLWEDVMPTINKQRPPEPFVMRSNTYDCVKYLHANLVPEIYELDDYQVRTPTDIIGQHIHLPKWDLTANDGAGNGWNYEDGTLSPGAVQERIEAINHFAELNPGQAVKTLDLMGNPTDNSHLEPKGHPFFAAAGANDPDWVGARTTIQRWFTDPVLNKENEDRGLGIVFTHDHYGPSTHQQVGLYATILAEPANSVWAHNETGEILGTRHDGGPTSWQAMIKTDTDNDNVMDAGFREFYFEFGDFQHAYQKGVYVGADANGKPLAPHQFVNLDLVNGVAGAAHGGVTAETFRESINPSYRQMANENGPDIVKFLPTCPGGIARPCSEAISADDIGMLVMNYRNEPIGLRVYDPNKIGPDGKPGMQADGLGGDLAFALQTRTDRAIPAFNTKYGDTPYPVGSLNADGAIKPGDPFTPLIRSYPADEVKIKIQTGSTEHEHNTSIHGVKWLQGGSGHGTAPTSGWRNAQNAGISEQLTFSTPVSADLRNVGATADYAYSTDVSQDGWWTGMWGIMRTYENKQKDLATLPSNINPKPGRVLNRRDFSGVCPKAAPVSRFDIVAIAANDLLGNALNATLVPANSQATQHVGGVVDPAGGTLMYNNRTTQIRQITLVNAADPTAPPLVLGGKQGPLHDPTALMYVMAEDLEPVPGQPASACADRPRRPGVTRPSCEVQLKATAPVEPVIIRANAGDCMKVTLYNKLPLVAPDLGGFNTLLQMVTRDKKSDGDNAMTTFNNNLIRPSSHVGLHPQLVEYDVTRHDGVNVGINKKIQTVAPLGFYNPRDDDDDDGDGIKNRDDDDVDGDGIENSDDYDDVGFRRQYTYTWYAGDLDYSDANRLTDCSKKRKKAKKRCEGKRDLINLVATPVEFGGFNLTPADKIKQGQKGLIGAGTILPEGSTVSALEVVPDRQAPNGSVLTRTTRSMTTVTTNATTGENFRDMSVIFQKGLNQRFADGTAIPNIASEGQGIPEDSHDAGQMAINYGSEPLWFRFGMPSDAPFGNGGNANSLGGIANSHETFSNVCCTNGGAATTADQNIGDPVTPVFTAAPGQAMMMRVLQPTGVGRGTTFNLHGHAWQRDPYIADQVASQHIGHNPIGMVIGHQESVTPMAHYDIVPTSGAGGKGAVPGDYLFQDKGSFGTTSGLWGILRVE